jgi:hypothetical protein
MLRILDLVSLGLGGSAIVQDYRLKWIIEGRSPAGQRGLGFGTATMAHRYRGRWANGGR